MNRKELLKSLIFKRQFSMKAKPAIIPDENIVNNINNNMYKPRRHPGIMQSRSVLIPGNFTKAVQCVLEDYPVKTMVLDSEKLSRHLKGRAIPMEREKLKEVVRNVQEKVISRQSKVEINNEKDEAQFKQMVRDKAANILKEKVYNWQPLKYDTYNSLLYMISRSAPEYAVLVKIFAEISSRDTEFKPRSLFDFGSGVGTVTWAAKNFWNDHIFEYFNVDISRDMNDLAETLLHGGKGSGKMQNKGVFYRQFLPSGNVTYDMVISAYSLMELPSSKARLETLVNLWNKTEKYLIVVEQGTNAGFKVINEIRDFILQIDKESNIGHVFSPCSHDRTCPRFLLDDGTPCNFEVSYFSLPIGCKSTAHKELYSFVVLKKGRRNLDDPSWPRIVRKTLVRSKHSICRICTENGKLDEVIFTASKHGKVMYHCARASKWGDLLPLKVPPTDDIMVDNCSENFNPT